MTMKTGTSRCKSTMWLLVPLVAVEGIASNCP